MLPLWASQSNVAITKGKLDLGPWEQIFYGEFDGRRRKRVLAAFIFFTLFPVSLLWANSFGWLAVAFAIRGLKEFGEPARKALIIGEAAPEFRSRTYGAYYLIRDCVVTAGSFLGAWLWSLSPQANFIGAVVCGAAGTAWFWSSICRRKR